MSVSPMDKLEGSKIGFPAQVKIAQHLIQYARKILTI